MKINARTLALSAAAAVVVMTGTSAQAQTAAPAGPKPEQLIKWRQSAYQVIAWNNGRIKASLDGTYHKEDVQKAANAIAALANSGLGALYAPGTDKGTGWHPTTAKPEIWAAGSKVGEYATNFSNEANELAKVAATGDVALVKAQFGKLGRTCKACHDDYKAKD